MGRTGVILLGAGGGTRELIALIRHAAGDRNRYKDWELRGVLDDNQAILGTEVAGVPVLGPLAATGKYEGCLFLNGIANVQNTSIRRQVAERLALPAERWATFVHPRAVVLEPSQVGHGAIVYPHAVISAGAAIAPHVVAYFGAVVHHDSRVGEGTCVCAGVLIAGRVEVGRDCYLGIGSVVRDRVRIGDGAIVGAGAVVVKDVPPGATVVGVPARPQPPR